ncbi:hypothetical protein A3A39_01725 [Candidatus Kaiserbacteria bacterium RIFCSPLOWO2_01_FULL_54_13]|uniref:Uncharacterized protein n=1 Tax=Candidatus Kaiserbacteria bacterium RIFCSPLOWO2_01_FULL_54_13 TaxID=1798512 RepID=A0A1F6F1F0_9BACT|nr:MAG: hypothetical protein A3A39_01725 [Candidatus Kaiserbacteria bacterium RIFCSPLOWO2_01_FULL_54_13]
MRFVEKPLAPFHEVHVLDTGLDNGVPTARACPPVSPEIEVGSDGIRGIFLRVRDGSRLGVIFRVAAFAELIAVPCWDAEARSLASVLPVVVAPVRAAPDIAPFFPPEADPPPADTTTAPVLTESSSECSFAYSRAA